MMLEWLIQLARRTWAEPAPAFRQLLDLRLSAAIVWQVTVLMTILLVSISLLAGPPPISIAPGGAPSPFVQFALQLIFLVVPAGLMQAIGQALSRPARLADCLLVILWAQAVVLPFQIVLSLTLYRAPTLAGGFMLVLIVSTLWLLTVFIAELFGYASRARVFMALLGVMLTIGLIVQAFLPAGMI